MARVTRYTVYIDKGLMTEPVSLYDAVMSHFIKKGMDFRERRRFIGGFLKAGTAKEQVEFINSWVLVRDVETFPFRFNKEGKVTDADTAIGGEVPVDDGADDEPEQGTSSD